jgi:tetratricopeptide (TPR) repeat protein
VQLFEATLENDETFVRDLNDMELLISGIKKSASLTTMDEKLERFEKSIKIMADEKEDIKTLPRTIYFAFEHIKKYSWAIAASITLIMVSSIALFNINQTPSHQKLYAEYFSPFENYGNTRSIESTTENAWKLALLYYDNDNYDSALANFERIQISDFKGTIKHPSFPLYKGNTLMKLGRHREAITIFENMVKDDDGMIIQAKWYLSMCYLHENNTEKFIPLIEEIAELKASSYRSDAQEILEQIN